VGGDTTNREQFRPISSAEQAVRYIRELIFGGQLPAGSHIPQDDIAHDLGMSRIPIREALITLERQGWVSIERHRGAFVQALSPENVLDHYELFGLTYGFAAVRAVERGDAELASRLRGLTDQLDALAGDPSAFGSVARRFHKLIVEAADSPRIGVVLSSLSNLVPGDFFARVPGSIEVERAGLTAVRDAIERRDGDAAASAYADMMRPIGELVVEVFDQQGLFDHVATDAVRQSS
jgi:DNA-binding GntR family transcriptional regulator